MTVSDDLESELVFDRLVRNLVRICTSAISAERGVLVMDRPAGLFVIATVDISHQVTTGQTPLRDAQAATPISLIEYVVQSGQPVVLPNARSDPRFNNDPYFDLQPALSIIAVPIGRTELTRGVMYFEKSLSSGAWAADEARQLRTLLADVSDAFENSLFIERCLHSDWRLRLLSDTSKALGESLDFEASLRKVGRRWIPAFADWFAIDLMKHGKLAPVAVGHIDPEKTKLVQELHEKYPPARDPLHPAGIVLRSRTPLLVSHLTEGCLRSAVTNDDHLRLLTALDPRSVIAVPLVSRKKVLGHCVFVRSISGKSYDKEDLQLAEELAVRIAQTVDNAVIHRELQAGMRQRVARDRFLKITFQQIPGAVWTTDRELKITYVTGRNANELKRPTAGVTIFDVLGTSEPTDAVIACHRAALAGKSQSFEYRLSDRWYAVFVEPLRVVGEEIVGCVGAAFDITEQREIQERLAEGQARLAEAQRVAHIGSFEWDTQSDKVIWSDELYRIYGVEPGRFAGTYDAFLQYVLPEDLEFTKTTLFEAFRNVKPFTYDHRIKRPDGGTRILHTRGEVIPNETGKPVRMVGSCWDITELNEAISKMKTARSLLEATIEATADGLLVVDRTSRLATYNRRFLSLWHIDEDLAKQGVDRKLIDYVADQLEDPSAFSKTIDELYQNPERESFDVLRFKDGRVYERYSTPERIGDQIVGRVWSFRDVTERERLLRRALFLADAARLLASLDIEPALDSVAHLAVPFIGDGCAVDLLGNGGPRRLRVVSRGAETFHPELDSAVLSGHSSMYLLRGRSCMAIPLVTKGSVIGAMTFLAPCGRVFKQHDLDLVEELGRRIALSVQNARLFGEAQEALKSRDEFLSIAAHEIRGPITSLHMAVQSLQRGKVLPESMPKVLQIIERADRLLIRFVDELLDITRIRTQRMHFKFEDVDLGDVVRQVSTRLAPELARSGSSLSITSKGPAVGQWDSFRLAQVITNLLSNAIKFGLGKPIEVSIDRHDGIAKLEIKDRGIGIPKEMMDKIFKPFERAVSVRHYGGLGLGLYIAHTIVDGLGGTIRVESQPNAGSTVIVELPLVRSS
jgi:signal transduction histidine kinase/transcriptional regulator with GAF, ATPase, and Fis domain